MAKKTADKQQLKDINDNITASPATAASPFVSGKDLSMEDLFLGEIKDIYWSEKHLVQALPKMIAAAGDERLKDSLKGHLKVTVNQVTRLEDVFSLLSIPPLPKKCNAMEGLTMGGEHLIENTVANTQVRDAALIMSGLKVENFEITAYEGLIRTAEFLDRRDIASLLDQNLKEEQEAAELLNSISNALMKNK